MQHSPNEFKRPPKKYKPRGMSILYEDRDIIVVDKVSGLLTVGSDKVRNNTAYFHLNTYVRKGNSKSRNRVFIVHRLDRETSGVIVFAKTEQAKQFLQAEWPGFEKTYYAVACGKMPEEKGIISSYLTENAAQKMYSVTDPKQGKLARTEYKVLKENNKYSLIELKLLTGRKNQIRVHLADQGCPVAGDKKYGTKEKGVKRLALHAASLTLLHPHSEKKMTLTSKMPSYFEMLMKSREPKR